jgi:preprotein translocase subunit SecG
MGLAMEGTLIMPVLLIVIVAVIILIAIMRSASKSKGLPPVLSAQTDQTFTMVLYHAHVLACL